MNKNELHGNICYAGGKVEKGIGDIVDNRAWQADSVIDQVAGSAEHLYGRAKSIAGDAMDAAPALTSEGREKIQDAASHTGRAVEQAGRTAANTITDNPVIWALAAGIGGYALSWFIHGRD